MAAANTTATTYLPYEVPLRLAGALRRAARRARLNGWRHLVPGGVLLWWRARARPRIAWRAAGALPWRLPGDAVASVAPAASPAAPVSATPSVSPAAAAERDVRHALGPAAAVGVQQATPPRAGPPESVAVREAAAVSRVRSGRTVAPLLVWTRAARARARAASGTSPLPHALLAARPPSPPPVCGVTAARLSPAHGPEPASGRSAGRPVVIGGSPSSRRVAPIAGPAAWGPHGEPPFAPSIVARGTGQRRPGWVEQTAPWPEKRTSAAPPETTVPRLTAERVSEAAPLAWKTPGLAAALTQLSGMVERVVARQVAERRPAAPPAPAAPAPLAAPAGVRAAAAVVTEQMVTQVVGRLRALAREERFRSGRRR